MARPLSPSPFSFFRLVGGEDAGESRTKAHSWHVCPKCIEPLAEWFVAQPKEATTEPEAS